MVVGVGVGVGGVVVVVVVVVIRNECRLSVMIVHAVHGQLLHVWSSNAMLWYSLKYTLTPKSQANNKGGVVCLTDQPNRRPRHDVEVEGCMHVFRRR